jgi:hypothetical protein
MVNNQVDFNNEYSKEEIEEIKIEDEEFEENHLIIENYSELKNLSLSDNEGIEKIILRNLEKLEKCKI